MKLLDKLDPPTRGSQIASAARVLIGLVVFLGASTYFVIEGASGLAEGDVLGGMWRLAGVAVGLGAITFLLAYIPGLVRACALRKAAEGSRVFLVRTDQTMSDAIQRAAPEVRPRTRSTVGLVISDLGFSLWGGILNPYKLLEVTWGQIETVKVVDEIRHPFAPNPIIAVHLKSGEKLKLWISSERRLGWDTLSADDHERLVNRFFKQA